MSKLNAAVAGTFKIGGEIEISRLGFGALHIVGKEGWGQPTDKIEILEILRRLPEIGVNFVDTADCYGPDISEWIIKEALFPYNSNLVIGTKGGVLRPNKDSYIPLGRPEYLFQQVYKSLRNLGLEQIDLWQLHRLDPNVPADEQYDAIKQMIEQGLIRYAGLSEVNIDDIQMASKYFKVSTVQNIYNIMDRKYEAVLDYCTANNIGFIPWQPLAYGTLTKTDSLLNKIALKYEATTSQIALAWLLKRSPIIIPIPGTSKVKHLEENVSSANIELTDDDFQKLNNLQESEFID